MPRRFVLTGAPGAGKTALIRALELQGIDTVEEAATDVIALEQARGIDAPWADPGFIGRIAELQVRREAVPMAGDLRFSDRSIFCTLALAEHLGHPVPASVTGTAEALLAQHWFEPRVLFVDLMDTITPTPARRISLEASQAFALTHAEIYRRAGFELLHIAPAPLAQRLLAIQAAIS